MQDKPTVGLYRAASMDGDFLAAFWRRQFRSQLLEHIRQGQALRAVDHQPHRAIGVVLNDVGQGLRKVLVVHVGHGDQELMLEITRRDFFHES
ncbi:hypothetical protein ALP29_200471 [Pseudomonas syringae pv. avii]|uniref:Uncharacterized protein n=1 Tax=Pseudomonas syringae pv. avii TaxID=663959 RepID=A0A3M5VC78_PSESX|nr:hypothetical protein ALP29_200471 [Pseudomonas syringae pv. avii]